MQMNCCIYFNPWRSQRATHEKDKWYDPNLVDTLTNSKTEAESRNIHHCADICRGKSEIEGEGEAWNNI